MKNSKRQRYVKPDTETTLAKITRPIAAGAFARTRLFRRLDRARTQPIVWLSAPAGSGKTTLIASYLQVRKLSAIWYHMDAGDHDIASFFYYMKLAANALAPDPDSDLPLLTSEYRAGLSVFATNYFRQLFGKLKSPSVIVFDNYQDISPDQKIQEIVQLGLDQIPAGVNVIVASREAPPSSFARSRAGGRIELLEWADMKLTEQESAAILKLRRKQSLFTHTAVSRLHNDTQGWVAGLVLLAESTEHGLMDATYPGVRTNRSIYDYFANEIFRRSDTPVQEFLLKTAIVPAVTVSVAQSLTGVANAREIFADLTQRNLFTFRRLQESFEYHPLFRAFLVELAHKRYSEDQMRALKQEAAQHLSQSGEPEAAVTLLLEAHDWEAALHLIVSQASSLIAQGRTQTVEAWLEMIPESIRCNNARALYWQGICGLAKTPAKARSDLEKAFSLFEKQDNTSWLYLTWSAVIDSFLREMSDFAPMFVWLDRYPALAIGREPPSVSIQRASVFTYIYGALAAGGDRADLHNYAQSASAALESDTDPDRYLARATVLIPYYLWRGEVTRVRVMLDRAAPYIHAPTARPFAQLNWHMWMSLYCSMTGASVDSLRYANDAVSIAGASGIHSVDLQILVFGIRGHLCLGNTVAARVLLERLALVANQGPAKNAYYSHHASLVALHEGDIARAVDEGRRAVKFSQAASLFIGAITSLIGLAYAYAQQGEVDASFESLAEAKSKAVGLQSKCFTSYCLFCEAIIHRIKGEHAQVLAALREALALARDGNFVTSAYCPRDIAAELYALALENDIEHDYVQIVIRKTQLPPPRNLLPEHWPWRLRIYSLGRFTLTGNEVRLDTGGVAGSKAQKKPLELLRAMVAFGGRDVSTSKLAHALWPDTDGDIARSTLRSTLLRLRRLIGEEAIVQQGNYLSLNPEYCWLDMWAFEQVCDERRQVSPALHAERVLKLYGGKFLPDDDEPWLINQRERLRSKALRLITECGAELEAHDCALAAADVYQKGLEIDPLAEDLYRKLMHCYLSLNRPAEALTLYQRCRAALSRSLRMEPTAETKLLYREIQQLAV